MWYKSRGSKEQFSDNCWTVTIPGCYYCDCHNDYYYDDTNIVHKRRFPPCTQFWSRVDSSTTPATTGSLLSSRRQAESRKTERRLRTFAILIGQEFLPPLEGNPRFSISRLLHARQTFPYNRFCHIGKKEVGIFGKFTPSSPLSLHVTSSSSKKY